jgi:HEAT repeat protein
VKLALFLSLLLAGCLPSAASPENGPRYDAAGVAALVETAASEQEPEGRRARAVRELRRTELRTHLPLLRRLLRQERSLDIRLAAACTLAELGDRGAPRDLLLVTAYEGTRTPSCSQSEVLLALGRLGDPASVLHFDRALSRPAPADEPFYYADACRGLAMLETPDSRRLLLRALEHTNPEVRHAAVTPASEIARDRSLPEREYAQVLLRRAAQGDPVEKVAEQAGSALFWNGADGPAFWALLEEDDDPRVRSRMARVLNRHFLSTPRLERLRQALEAERHPDVRAAMEATLASQPAQARD